MPVAANNVTFPLLPVEIVSVVRLVSSIDALSVIVVDPLPLCDTFSAVKAE